MKIRLVVDCKINESWYPAKAIVDVSKEIGGEILLALAGTDITAHDVDTDDKKALDVEDFDSESTNEEKVEEKKVKKVLRKVVKNG